MKTRNILSSLLSALLISFSFSAFAEEKVVETADKVSEKVLVQNPAVPICRGASENRARQLEATWTKSTFKDISTGEVRYHGSGTGLFLFSVFVKSPKTGDNTHWETVAEFNYKTNTCKVIASRHFEAP